MGADDWPERPQWWDWELIFTPHSEERMLERGVSELELRTMLQAAKGLEPTRRPGRWLVRTHQAGEPWVVVVEPDETTRLLVIVTVYRRG
jgi:hypothetical protein